MFGLSDKDIDSIHSILQKNDKVRKVVIYGSRAKGTCKIGSDIDLVFYGDDLTLDILHKIDGELDDLYLPYSFDLSIISYIDNENLLAHIDRIGKVFYQKEDL